MVPTIGCKSVVAPDREEEGNFRDVCSCDFRIDVIQTGLIIITVLRICSHDEKIVG